MPLIWRLLLTCFVLGASGSIRAEWRNCDLSEHGAEEVFDVFFEHFKKIDPGEHKLIDPKGCKIDVDCTPKGDAIHAKFSVDCVVLFHRPKAKEHLKPTGDRFKLQKTVIVPKNAMPYLKE